MEALHNMKVRSENIKHCTVTVNNIGSPITVQNESEKKMWTEYMKEAETYDSRDSNSWKADSDGLLVFVRPNILFPWFTTMTSSKTGLFSAIVGAFIIEFYKKLSPDSGDQTVNLLCQISQQLPNSMNGNCSTLQTDKSFSPGASIIWVNSMWIMSLLLSLTSALFATLLQQWARRYVQMPQIPTEPKQRARVRSFLFFGARKFNMRIAVETAPTLLHLSVFLFFIGLVILFYTIHKTVAIIVSICVGIFVVAYVTLTILPYIYHNCPYHTSMSNIWWYISHITLFSFSFCFHRLVWSLHDWLVPPNLGVVNSNIQRILVSGLDIFKRTFKKHGRRLKDGFRQTVVQMALETSDDVDLEALTWWLEHPALVEESKAQDFLACIPRQTVVQLMSDPDRKLIFKEHLLTLLRSCIPGSLAVGGLEENERKARLLVYLRVIHRITHDFVNQNSTSGVDINFVRSNFAEISRMQAMWADSDAGNQVTSRSICALLARCILRRSLPRESEQDWLQAVTGVSPNSISISDTTARNRMNLTAFLYGALAHQGGDLPAEHATSFTKTLAILMTPEAEAQSSFDRTEFQKRLSDLIVQIEQDATTGSTEVVEKLHRMFNDLLPVPTPGVTQQP
jgi:hypothetical protein